MRGDDVVPVGGRLTGPAVGVRDAARALGYDVGQQDAWSKSIERWGTLRGPRTGPGRR
ncbi:hypothetical protein CHMI_03115 [Cellulomonas hominis]|nr:hypothetical protein CHMI_03115 [Cellulomonas hominis]